MWALSRFSAFEGRPGESSEEDSFQWGFSMGRLKAPMLVNKVASVRRASGLTQKELAQKVGLSRQTIVEIEAGGYNPSTVAALRISVALNSLVDDLFELAPSRDEPVDPGRVLPHPLSYLNPRSIHSTTRSRG